MIPELQTSEMRATAGIDQTLASAKAESFHSFFFFARAHTSSAGTMASLCTELIPQQWQGFCGSANLPSAPCPAVLVFFFRCFFSTPPFLLALRSA